MLAVLKASCALSRPAVQPVEGQVYMPRVVWLVANVVRNCSAAPPFSTTSPSGRSDADTGVPLLLLFQKVLVALQKLFAPGEVKPVAGFTAATSSGRWNPGRSCIA